MNMDFIDEENQQFNNIEDLIKPFWFKTLTKDQIDKCYNFIDEYYFNKKLISEIKKDFIIYQSKNNFNNILKFGSLICIYKLGRFNNRYLVPHVELESILKVKNIRENSGVMVFSIFTSAYPSYTKILSDGSKVLIKEFENKSNTQLNNPGAFSCTYDCAYCPNEPDQPRSYLKGEPGVDRAIQNNYDPIRQIFSRACQYIQQGHPVDKIEVIIQGGTWDSYSIEYRTEFVRDIYYAFNVFMDWVFYNSTNDNKYKSNSDVVIIDKKYLRPKFDLEHEIIINETAPCRVIGLTPETRPDQINASSIMFLRKIGATRVQIGVQHLDDNILRYINRRCYRKDTIRAIQMLKDNGFKVDCHLMLDLPAPTKNDLINKITYEGNMPEIDKQMLNEFNTNSNFKVDQIKIYPCVVTPYTKIKEWYDAGIYKPYGENIIIDPIKYRKMSKQEKITQRMLNPLYKNILEFYSTIHPSIRVNRIIRDIPTNIICGGTTQSGMRSDIISDIEALGLSSGCIRYREAGSFKNIKNKSIVIPVLKELVFNSSGGIEYFLSYESEDENPILYSFLRLRISPNAGKTNFGKIIFPELENCALIRELHTYGKVTPCKDNLKYYKDNNILLDQDSADKSQHKGFGKKLLERAEQIAISNGYEKIAVISGVGVREYYRKNGYLINSDMGCFQIKYLNKPANIIRDIQLDNSIKITNNYIYWILFFVILILFLIYI